MQVWDNVTRPIGTIQIIKSVTNKYHKYNKLAEFLNKNGYVVFCNKNQPQHGDVFTKTVEQEIETLYKIKQKYNLPLFLVGHGFGGFVAQKIISHTHKCNGAICTAGGGKLSRIEYCQCVAMTWIGQHLFGDNKCAKMIPKICKCDNGITYNHTYWILKGTKHTQYDKNINVPQMFICGKQDISGLNNRLAWTLYNAYNQYDLHKLTFVLFPDAASPIESGENWMDVRGDILQVLTQYTSDAR